MVGIQWCRYIKSAHRVSWLERIRRHVSGFSIIPLSCLTPPPSPPEGWGSGGHVNIENRPIYMFTLLVFIVFFCIVNLDSFDLIFSKGIHIRFPMCEILLLVLWVHLFYVWLILCSILISAYTEHVRVIMLWSCSFHWPWFKIFISF